MIWREVSKSIDTILKALPRVPGNQELSSAIVFTFSNS